MWNVIFRLHQNQTPTSSTCVSRHPMAPQSIISFCPKSSWQGFEIAPEFNSLTDTCCSLTSCLPEPVLLNCNKCQGNNNSLKSCSCPVLPFSLQALTLRSVYPKFKEVQYPTSFLSKKMLGLRTDIFGEEQISSSDHWIRKLTFYKKQRNLY